MRIRINYLLHCSLYINEKLALLNVIRDIDSSILKFSVLHILEVLLNVKKSSYKPKGLIKIFL